MDVPIQKKKRVLEKMKISFGNFNVNLEPNNSIKTKIIENKLYLENYTLTITHSSEIQDSSQLIMESNKSVCI